jgi:MFS family permease
LRLDENTKSLATVYAPALFMSFGTGMTLPAIPLLAASFDVSLGVAAQVVTAQLVGRLVFVMPAGVIVDRIGSRKAMLIGPAIIGAAAIGAGFAPSFPLLLLAVFAQGAGSNLWQIAREIAVISLVKPDQRGRALSAFFGLGQVGMTLGPIIGGAVADVAGFRALFLVYALIACFVMGVAFAFKEVSTPRRHRTSMFSFGRLSDVEPIFRTTFMILVFATFCMMLRQTVYGSMVPLYVGTELDYSATEVGTLFGIAGLANLLLFAPAGYISDKIGRKAATVPAAVLTGLSFLVMGFADTWPMLVLAAAIHGTGAGMAQGSMSTSTYDISPEGAMARLQSLRRFSAEIGSLAGPPLAGMVAGLYSAQGVFLVFAPLYAISAFLLAFIARETHPHRRAPVPVAATTPPPAT